MEIWVLLFLLAGHIKEFILFYRIPVPIDITLLALLGGGLHCAFLIFKNHRTYSLRRYTLAYVVLLLLFLFWIGVSMTYSPSVSQKFTKLLGLMANSLFLVYICVTPSINIKRLIRYFVFLVSLMAVAFLLVFTQYLNTPRIYEIVGLYLGLGVMLGISALLVWYKFQELVGWGRYKRGLYVLAVCLMLVLYAARGPLVFLLLTFGMSEFLNAVQKKWDWQKIRMRRTIAVGRSLFIVGGAAVALFFSTVYGQVYTETLIERALLRFTLLFDAIDDGQGGGHSISQRIDYIDFSFESILSSPRTFFLGNGFASFGILYTNEDVREYPHNIILEMWFETGLIGVLFLVAWLIFGFSGILANNRTWIHWTVIAFCLFNSLKSGSIVDARVLFVLLPLGLLRADIEPHLAENDK